MRIAVISANQGLVGGGESYVAWLLAELVQRGHQVAFAFEWATTDPDQAVGGGVEPLIRWDLQAVPRSVFLAELAAFQPDVVFLQALEDETLDLVLTQQFRAILFAHAYYATCATGWRVHRIPERQICTRRFGPACLPINYLRGCGARSPISLLQLYSKQRARSNVLRGLEGLVVASEHMRQVFIQQGVPDSCVHVIPPPPAFLPDSTAPAPRGTRNRVLFLGRLTTGKGAVKAIRVAARSQRALGRPLHLTMAGDGPELGRCRELAAELGIATDFLGWLGPEQRMEQLRSTDVLLVPSLWPEPFGMVGIEAASVGVPAVAYPAGGIVDWLRPGVTGELAAGRGFGTQALADALARALRDAEHYRALQLGAWQMAHEFSGDRQIPKLEALFRSVSEGAPTQDANATRSG